MTKKKRYEVFANGQKNYTYSNNPSNAFMNIFKRLKKKFGVCNITDMHIETSKNVYVRISYTVPWELMKKRDFAIGFAGMK